MRRSGLKGIQTVIAKPLEQRLREAATSKEPIAIDATEGTYTQGHEGVRPELDIRTDRQILALEAIEKVRTYRELKQKSEAGETLKE